MISKHHFPPSIPTVHFEAGITEVPSWSEPTRVIVLTTDDGVRQWRCEGLASNVTPEGLRLLADLLEQAEVRHGVSPTSPHLVPSDVSRAG